MRTNPFDRVLDDVVAEMHHRAGLIDAEAGDVEPFASKRLRPDEALLLYRNPAAHPALAGMTDPATGMPLSNAQAGAALLQQMGPEQYVDWVTEMDRLERKQTPEVPADG
jgi:hypothetical protein